MSYIELKNIEKSYGKKIVLKNFNLSVERGEFVGIQGEQLLEHPDREKVHF